MIISVSIVDGQDHVGTYSFEIDHHTNDTDGIDCLALPVDQEYEHKFPKKELNRLVSKAEMLKNSPQGIVQLARIPGGPVVSAEKVTNNFN